MRVRIELGEGTARTDWVGGEDFVGWSDKLHGGIIATLLDEVMAWAPSSYDSWAVTAEMTVRYRSPAMPGERLEASGARDQTPATGLLCGARGGPPAPDGRLVTKEKGRYLGATPSEKAELKEQYRGRAGSRRRIVRQVRHLRQENP